MQIQPVKNQYNSSFKGIRYKNGIITEKALDANMQRLLPLLERKCSNMKNVDLILSEENKIQLDIKTPRYLNQQFKRFYGDNIVFFHDNGRIGISNEKTNDCTDIKFLPTDSIGIYDIQTTESDSFNNHLSKVLKIMEIIEKASDNIRNAEQAYGMNCVTVLDNADKLNEETKRLILIDKIKESYVADEEYLKIVSIYDLKKLLNYSDVVKKIKNYKIAIQPYSNDSNHIAIEIVDTNGYLNPIYSEFYERSGLEIKDKGGTITLKPTKSKFTIYTFYDKGGNKYRGYMDYYDGGRSLNCIEFIDELLRITNQLDSVGSVIETYLKENK